MLQTIAKVIKAINSQSSVRQIALAVTLGFMMGLTPLLSLQNIIILFLVMFIRVHLGSFILSLGFFSGVGYLLSDMIISVGESVLTAPSLNGLFTQLYQFTFYKLAHWHQTYTFGALVLGVVLAIPLYFATKFVINNYRQHIMSYLEKLYIVRVLKASKIVSLYNNLAGENLKSGGAL